MVGWWKGVVEVSHSTASRTEDNKRGHLHIILCYVYTYSSRAGCRHSGIYVWPAVQPWDDQQHPHLGVRDRKRMWGDFSTCTWKFIMSNTWSQFCLAGWQMSYNCVVARVSIWWTVKCDIQISRVLKTVLKQCTNFWSCSNSHSDSSEVLEARLIFTTIVNSVSST